MDNGLSAEVSARLVLLERRVAAIIRCHEANAAVDQPLRGLYLSHEQAVELLGAVPEPASAGERQSVPLGPLLGAIAERCRLQPVDIDILVCALAPDVDARYEKLFGFIHDDLTMRRPTVGLAMRLSALSPMSADRLRFDVGAPLVANALLRIEQPDRPFLSRVLRAPDHVASVLAGATATDGIEQVLTRCRVQPVWLTSADGTMVADQLGRDRTIHIRDGGDAAAAHVVATAARALRRNCLIIDLDLCPSDQLDVTIDASIRHRALTGDLIVVRSIDALAEHPGRRLDDLARLGSGIVLIGRAPWDPANSAEIPIRLDVRHLTDAELIAVWRRALADSDLAPGAIDIARRSYRLTPEQIRLTARSATLAADGGSIGFAQLSAAAKSQSTSGLDRLARRLEASATWDDLVLPAGVMTLLNEVAVRVRWRERVMQEWGLGRGWRGRGLAALFAGPSGTGKTTAAEVIAGDLGYDIHIVDLSTVVDKYIGETEKKLEVIFTEAERSNTVLLFDEADAIFGKRSEVKEAKDRYANIEVSYLLQRIERFSGLAILTTNLGANLDEAFTRRLDVVVDFPRPDAVAREAIWRREFRPGVPTEDIDFVFCAQAFDLTGGNIRNVVTTAAFLAADAGTAVTMREVVTAVQREFHKMGRLNIASEFGPYQAMLT